MSETIVETKTERRVIPEGNEENQWSGITRPDDAEEVISSADALISEVRGDEEATVNIYRLGVGRGKEAFLYATSPEDISARDIMERCRDEYGGGDFKMVVRDSEKIVSSARFSVEAVKTAPTVEKDDGDMKLLTMMQSMMQNQNTLMLGAMQAFGEAFKGNQAPVVDPNTTMKTIMESVAAMKMMTEPPKNDAGSEMVNMLLKGLTLAKELNGKDGDTNTHDLLGKAMDMLPSLANAMPQQPRPGDPATMVNQQHPGPAIDAQTQESIEREQRMHVELEQLKQHVLFLLVQAKANRDPAIYAEFILDQAGVEKTLDFIGNSDALDRLILVNPEVASYRPWFEELREAILSLTAPEEPGENEVIEGTAEKTDPDAISGTNDDGNPTVDSGRPGGSPSDPK